MQAQLIALIVVDDIAATVEYLENRLGFAMHRISDGGEFAVMVFRGVFLMLESRRLYTSSREVAFGENPLGLGMEILLKIPDVDDAYHKVRASGAVITRTIHSVAETAEFNIRRFSTVLPDGYTITFFDYVHTELY